MTSNDQDALLTPGEAAFAGAALGITVYGLAVVVASLFADKELVPSSVPLAGVVMIVSLVVGAIVGSGVKAMSR